MTTAPTAPVAAFVERDIVLADGPEATSYLQGQLSQDVAALAVGASARSFVLQPQGKVVAWLRVTRTGADTFLLDTEPGAGEALLARLQRFKLRTAVDLTADTWPCVAIRGEGAVEAGERARQEQPDLVVAPAGWPGVEGVDLLGPEVAWPAHVERIDDHAYDAVRIDAGVPAMGAEATEATIPAELGAWVIDASVSFTKGCYTGQELVARIDSRGSQVPHPVRVIDLVGRAVPPSGADVLRSPHGDPASPPASVGHVTSASWSTARSAPVALAVVARAVAPGEQVTVAWDDGSAVGAIRSQEADRPRR